MLPIFTGIVNFVRSTTMICIAPPDVLGIPLTAVGAMVLSKTTPPSVDFI